MLHRYVSCRISLALLGGAVLFCSSCAVPMAPGYRIERQQFEIAYVGAAPAWLHVRASYRLKNTGNSELRDLELRLPGEREAGRQKLRALVDGRDVQPSLGIGVAGRQSIHLLLDPPWARRKHREVVVEYDLHPTPPGDDALAVGEDSFHVRDASAFPILRAPPGTFTKGGEPPEQYRVLVRLPRDFHVFAEGREQGSRHQGDSTEHRFLVSVNDFPPYVVAGRYQEHRVNTANAAVIFWTLEKLPAEQAQEFAARLASTFQTYLAVFGPIWKNPPPVHVIETPARVTHRAANDANVAGVALPAGVLLTRAGFAMGANRETVLELAERELAHTWFGLRIAPRPESEPVLGEALADYAVIVAAEARGGEAERRRQANALLASFDAARAKSDDKPLLRVEPSSSEEEQHLAHRKGALFFLSLEDRFGEQTARRALARMVSSLRGTHYGFAELRAAVELESHQNASEFFRLWLDQTGIPAEVRSRYAQPAQGARTSQRVQRAPGDP